ncbi:MAG: hypothetical protein K2N14_03455 [Clostridia bacterium]|nr:hypothetical protein [Clostridia bacterium]
MTNEELKKLALAHINGADGLPKNEAKGYEYMKQAADNGDPDACAQYAEYAYRKLKDAELSVEYYEKGGKKEDSYAYALLAIAEKYLEKKVECFKKAAPCAKLDLSRFSGSAEIFCEWIDSVAGETGKAFANMNGKTIDTYLYNLSLIAQKQPAVDNGGGKSLDGITSGAGACLKKVMTVEEVLGNDKFKRISANGWKRVAEIAEAAGESEGMKEYLSIAELLGCKLTEREARILGREKGYIYGKDNFAKWFAQRPLYYADRPYGTDKCRFAPVKHSQEYAASLASAQFDAHKGNIIPEIKKIIGEGELSPMGAPQAVLLYEPVIGVTRHMGKGFFAYTTGVDRTYTYEGSTQVFHRTVDEVGSHDMYMSGFWSSYKYAYPFDTGKLDAAATDEIEHISGWESEPQAAGVRTDIYLDVTTLKECEAESTAICTSKLNEKILEWGSENTWAKVDSFTAGASIKQFIKETEYKLDYIPFYYFTFKIGAALLIMRINAYSGGYRYVVCRAEEGKSAVELFNNRLKKLVSVPAPAYTAPAYNGASTAQRPAKKKNRGKTIGIIVGCVVVGFIAACIIISEILNKISSEQYPEESVRIERVME